MWETVKKVFNFITSIILYSVFVLLAIVGLMVAAYFVDHYISVKQGSARAPLFGAYVIISNSMEPAIHVTDAVITMRVSPEKIKKGDVITFISSDPDHPGITITHRVMGIRETTNGGYAFETKGDNNNVEDKTPTSYDNVLGKVILRIPLIGKLQRLLLTNTGWLFIIVLPCAFIIFSDIIKLGKTAMASPAEEEEKEKDKKGKKDKKDKKEKMK